MRPNYVIIYKLLVQLYRIWPQFFFTIVIDNFVKKSLVFCLNPGSPLKVLRMKQAMLSRGTGV